jgi:tetratricopeptide (TPR) repeat protein
MAKTGRNDPCPCGSGKKYKSCCLTNDEAAERERLAAAVRPAALRLPGVAGEFTVTPAAAYYGYDDTDELTDASNAVVDLVHAGRLDEAEQAARDLLVRFPDEHDGYDRLGMVHEARGENRQAADCYRRVIAIIRDHPDSYDPGFDAVYQQLVDKLDPPAEPAS